MEKKTTEELKKEMLEKLNDYDKLKDELEEEDFWLDFHEEEE